MLDIEDQNLVFFPYMDKAEAMHSHAYQAQGVCLVLC